MTMVSVIIPVYKAANTLERALESVCLQTYVADNPLDIVLIFNGDTIQEDQRVALQYLGDNDNRNINWVFLKSTKGIVPALNTGITHARNCLCEQDERHEQEEWRNVSKPHFIARMDADDVWYPTKLERQVSYMLEHPEIDILGTQIRLVSDVSYLHGTVSQNPCDDKGIKEWLTVARNPIAHPSVMFKPSVMDRAGMYDDLFPMAEDFWLWCKAAKVGCKFANMPEVMMDYTATQNPNYNPLSPQAASHVYNLISRTFPST